MKVIMIMPILTTLTVQSTTCMAKALLYKSSYSLTLLISNGTILYKTEYDETMLQPNLCRTVTYLLYYSTVQYMQIAADRRLGGRSMSITTAGSLARAVSPSSSRVQQTEQIHAHNNGTEVHDPQFHVRTRRLHKQFRFSTLDSQLSSKKKQTPSYHQKDYRRLMQNQVPQCERGQDKTGQNLTKI